jgi:uncharacterized membrane protein
MVRAERGTSARVAIRFIPDTDVDALERAKAEFQKAEMHGHAERNAALILVAPKARQFAVVGDRDLHERVGDAYWNDVIDVMRKCFVAGDITGAVVAGVDQLGNAFREHFAA